MLFSHDAPRGLGASAPDRTNLEVCLLSLPPGSSYGQGRGQGGQRDELRGLGLLHPVPGSGLGCREGLGSLQTAAVSLRVEVPHVRTRAGTLKAPQAPLSKGVKEEEEQVAQAGHQLSRWPPPSRPWPTEWPWGYLPCLS